MMDKTININLGGTLFHIDEEAYKILKNYLQSIDHRFKNVPGGNETIEDIEIRIAEIFLSKKGPAGVISKENVEEMITIIGKPEDFAHGEYEAPFDNVSSGYSPGTRRMYRNPENSIIAGVCGGIGAYMNSDPVWFRILFIVFTMMGGLGIFVYLALWIALPTASTDTQKKEMYGGPHNLSQPQQWDKHQGSSVGHAFNEVFKAFGKVCYLIVRIFLILIGTSLVITGFLALLSFVLVFIFRYPGAISTDVTGINLSFFPDFLNYIVSQQMVPWIKTLILLVVSLPLLALTYGGIRLIFWFRTNDGFIWLAGLILWVISVTALSIILYNEGIGFAETAKISSQEYFSVATDTLYIRSAIKLSDIKIDKEIAVPGENDDVFYISDDKKEIYFHTNLKISRGVDTRASVEIRKRSSGRSRLDAIKKSERLLYNYNISGKTLYMDEFFTISLDKKWSFDNVSVFVSVPEGTILYMDTTVENLIHSKGDNDYVPDPEKRYWTMTEDGLRFIEPDKWNK